MKVKELIKKLQEIKEQDAKIIVNNLGNDDFIELGFIQDLELINNGNELDGNMFYVMVGVEFESTKDKELDLVVELKDMNDTQLIKYINDNYLRDDFLNYASDSFTEFQETLDNINEDITRFDCDKFELLERFTRPDELLEGSYTLEDFHDDVEEYIKDELVDRLLDELVELLGSDRTVGIIQTIEII